MIRVFLSLGANLGDRRAKIREALGEIDRLEATRLVQMSSLYDTDPVGDIEQPNFLNLVALVETDLGPRQLLWHVKLIERRLGRQPSRRFGPRTVDIDILLYGESVIDDPDLVVPHPRLTERAFVLVPLAEVAPDLVLPSHGETVRMLRAELNHDARRSVRRLGRPSY